MKDILAVALALCFWVLPAAAPVGDEVIEKSAQAKQQYEEGHYDQALQLYRQAQIEAPEARALNFNVGSTLFKTGDYAGAAAEFDAATTAEDARLKARSYYNLGNTHYQQQQYGQAVEAYKQALDHDWQDQDAKANLELALAKQQEQQQEQKEQQEQQQSQDQGQQQPQPGDQGQQQQDRQNQQNQQPQQDQQQGQAQQPSQQDAQGDQPERQGGEGRAGQRNRMDREEAEQLLDALRDREKQAHQRRQHGTQAYRGEDW